MIKVKDTMTSNVISTKKDTPILEAMRLLIKYDITGLPVVV